MDVPLQSWETRVETIIGGIDREHRALLGFMCKNGEKYVVDFACAESHRPSICRKLSSSA
jgi:hypothetical protein